MTSLRDPNPARAPFVLLIEDDDATRQIYVEALASAGYEAVGVGTWFEGEAVIRRLQPDAIVMDRNLPDADGWAQASRLKTVVATRSIPVIALTSNAEQPSVLGALQAGCDAFLAKPCTIEALLATIAKLLDDAEATGKSRRVSKPVPRKGLVDD